MQFDTGSWVSFTTSAGRHARGRVTTARGKAIRIVDNAGKQYTTSPKGRGEKVRLASVKGVSFGVFVLDAQLDKGWRSRRQSARFWEEYCYAADWTFAHERVHSVEDLRYFLEKRTIKEHVLIFSGHGSDVNGWELSNGECFGTLTPLKINPKNRHKVVIFSSCSIGRNKALCEAYLRLLGAEAIVTYDTKIDDDICFLAEPALLQLLSDGQKPRAAIELVQEAMDAWKGINLKYAKKFPLVCYTATR